MNTSVLHAALLSFLGYAIHAFGDAAAKHLTMDGFSLFEVLFIYGLIAMVLLLIFSPRLGGIKSLLKTRNPKLHLIRAFLFAPGAVLNFYAFSKMPLANAYTVLFMMPFVTTIFASFLLNEKTEFKAWLCILLGFTGVIVVNRPDLSVVEWPLLACLTSTLLAGLRNVVARKMGYEETIFSLSITPCISLLCISVIPTFLYGSLPDLKSAIIFIFGGLCYAGGVIMISLSFLYKVKLSLLTPYHYTQIIWGILLGAVLFGDFPDIYTWIGCAIIIVSGIALVYVHHPRRINPLASLPATSANNPDVS